MDFFTQLYLDLQERITDQVPAINWIEQDFAQDQYDQWRPSVDFPAVLIDFPGADYSNISGPNQQGIVTITMRLLYAAFSQSYADAPIEVRRDALSFFAIENELVAALHGWGPGGEYTQPLVRTGAHSDNANPNGLRIRTLTFTTAYIEYFDAEVGTAPLPDSSIYIINKQNNA